MNFKIITGFTIFCFILEGSCNSQCTDTTYSFREGEVLNYEVAYNWGILWVDAGEASFTVDTVTRNHKPCFHFDSYGKSYKFYDWFYKVRDHYESMVEMKSFRPVEYQSSTNEGGKESTARYIFDYEGSKVYTAVEENKNPLSYDTLQLIPCLFDVLSALYYTRNIDFSNIKSGREFQVKFIINSAIREISVWYEETELIKTRTGEEYRCLKFSAVIPPGTIFRGNEEVLVWVTDDKNKIPVLVEAKILVGSIKAYLTHFENLKFSQDAEITPDHKD